MRSAIRRELGAAGTPKPAENTEKYLSFRLAKEEFAIHVLSVHEIMGMQDVISVPLTPSYVKGAINLRGRMIPVIDLRMKWGFPEVEYTPRTCIVVVKMEADAIKLYLGVIVDSVADVLTLYAADIHSAPGAAPYVSGTVKIKNKVKTLIDINMVLTAAEVHDLATVLP